MILSRKSCSWIILLNIPVRKCSPTRKPNPTHHLINQLKEENILILGVLFLWISKAFLCALVLQISTTTQSRQPALLWWRCQHQVQWLGPSWEQQPDREALRSVWLTGDSPQKGKWFFLRIICFLIFSGIRIDHVYFLKTCCWSYFPWFISACYSVSADITNPSYLSAPPPVAWLHSGIKWPLFPVQLIAKG